MNKFFLSVMVVMFSGCTIYRPVNVSLGTIGPKEDAIAVIKGESSAFYVLFLGPFGDDSLAAAMDNARNKAKADSVTNVFIDRKLFLIPFIYSKRTTVLTGTAIRYRDDSFERSKGPVDSHRPASKVSWADEESYMDYLKTVQNNNKAREREGEKAIPIMSFEEWLDKKKGK